MINSGSFIRKNDHWHRHYDIRFPSTSPEVEERFCCCCCKTATQLQTNNNRVALNLMHIYILCTYKIIYIHEFRTTLDIFTQRVYIHKQKIKHQISFTHTCFLLDLSTISNKTTVIHTCRVSVIVCLRRLFEYTSYHTCAVKSSKSRTRNPPQNCDRHFPGVFLSLFLS